MFTILPLQVASNVFRIETPKDVERFYHFVNPATISEEENTDDGLLPSDIYSIKQLDRFGGDPSLQSYDIPQDTSKIRIFDDISSISPLNPGEACIISPFTQKERAYYRSYEKQKPINFDKTQ